MTDEAKKPGQKLGFFMCVALVMGNMIGSGVFLLPASLAPFGWNAVVGWIITIAGALALAWVIARLTLSMPNARGPIGFVTEAFGRVPGFLIGWGYWVSIWTAVVTIAVAAVSYLSSFYPAISAMPGLPAILAVGVLWSVTVINLMGVRSAGAFQAATVLIKLIPILVVIAIAASLLFRGTGEIRPFPAEGLSLSAINASIALTLWALLGFESASVASDKVEAPEKTIPRATLVGTALTGLLYLFVCSAIALMLPEAVASATPAPFATFVERQWGSGVAAFIALFATVSCVGALNGWVLMQGEVPRSMAEQGLLPRFLARTNDAGTPIIAILLSSLIASIFVLVNASRGMKSLFEYLLLLSTSTTLWLYLACALVALKQRVAVPIALLGAVYALWTLWGAGPEASGLSFVLMAAGLPVLWSVKPVAATAR
jgi:basic amino acid/polyamine antiporter, APA family